MKIVFIWQQPIDFCKIVLFIEWIDLCVSRICGINVWTPHFGSMRFPLEWRARFLVLKKLIFYLIKKTDLESSLIFVLFLKGKQNKKEKP